MSSKQEEADPREIGATPGVAWYDDWYMGVLFLCAFNILPGLLLLDMEEMPHAIDNFVIGGWITFDLLLLVAFASQNFSRVDIKANIVALLFSISSVVSAILLFASRYKVIGIIDTLNDKVVVKDLWTSIYFSVVTWTTVGFGDLVPTAGGRLYAACEALTGYLYMGLFIAQFIAVARIETVVPSETGES